MRPIKDETVLLRTALEEALARATEPLTCRQLAESPDIAGLGFTAQQVHSQLKQLMPRKRQLFPLARTAYYGGTGDNTRFAYYNPTVLNPNQVRQVNALTPTGPEPAPEPTVAPADEFKFNPVDLDDGASRVSLPAAKRITLDVGGVTIRIELTS